MKKILMILLILGALVFVAVAAIGIIAFRNLDKIVRVGTEKGLSHVLMVDVTVDGAGVDVKNGRVELRGINIPNPPGYNSSHAMRFGLVACEVDAQSFRTNEPVVRLINIQAPDIVVEKVGPKTNLQTLADNAARLASEEEKEPSDKQYRIDKLLVEDSVVRVAIPMSGGKTVSAKLPDVEKTNIGGGESVSPAEFMQEFLATLMGSIGKLGTGAFEGVQGLSSEAMGALESGLGSLEGVGGALGDVGKGVTGTVGDVGKGVGDAAGDAVRGLGGLLGGKKGEEDKE